MRKIITAILLTGIMLFAACAAGAETVPVTMEEIEGFASLIREKALSQKVLNDPKADEAQSEDGIEMQFEFGLVYVDRAEMTPETEISAIQIMDQDTPGPRGIAIDWEVSQVMEAIPCRNPDMLGTRDRALLYLEGDAGNGYRYGLVERDGQRIQAMEYGAADPAAGRRLAVTLQISGDGVNAIRVEGLTGSQDKETLAEMYAELEALGGKKAYARVPRSLNGAELEIFEESDLDFSAISYQTAVPEIFGSNVEDVLIDNDDGTWLRRVDGDGFSAVFTCDEQGMNGELISYTILSADLEGPRAVRLGDMIHEDLQRFRHGEGEVSDDGSREVLYGREGIAPYGMAEYGNGDEMTLRYVTKTLSGQEIELLLRYEDTILTEITLHTL